MRKINQNNEEILDSMKVLADEYNLSCSTNWKHFDFFNLYTKKQWEKELRNNYGRTLFTNCVSWSIPSYEAVNKVIDFCDNLTICEYMAGTAYWSYFLEKNGANVKPTDYKKGVVYNSSFAKTFVPVGGADIRKRKHKINTVGFFSWVPYGSDAIDNYLKSMNSGDKVVYLGEGDGGCTATDSTYEILYNNFKTKNVEIPQFSGLNDYIQLCIKK